MKYGILKNCLTKRYIHKNISKGGKLPDGLNETVLHMNLLSSFERHPFRAAALFLPRRICRRLVLTQAGRAVSLRPEALYRNIYDETDLRQ